MDNLTEFVSSSTTLDWSSGPVSRHICLTCHITTPCDCTVPAQWRSLLSDTTILLVTYLLTYLLNNQHCCTLTADVAGRQHLRSATQRKLTVPRYRLNSFGRRHFAVAGPSTWTLLPSWPRAESQHSNVNRRRILLPDIELKCTKHITDFSECVLHKLTL